MSKKQYITLQETIENQLKDAEFKQAWNESEAEYLLAKQLIEKRLEKKLSQRELAKRLHTSQAVISRLETMKGNPSLSLLKRIAQVLDAKLTVQLQ